MFKFLKRGHAAADVEKYVAHWMAAMNSAFRQNVNYPLDDKALKRISGAIVIAGVMNANASSPRLMSSVCEVLTTYGLDEQTIRILPFIARNILKGSEEHDAYEIKMNLLNQIAMGYTFHPKDADWFTMNIDIISEVLETALREQVRILAD